MIASRASGDRRVITTFADSGPKEMYILIFSDTGTDNGTYSAYGPCRAEAAPSAVSNHCRTLRAGARVGTIETHPASYCTVPAVLTLESPPPVTLASI